LPLPGAHAIVPAVAGGGSNLRFDVSLPQALAIASQFALTLVVSVVLGFAIGSWLDSRLVTSPVFMLVCSLLGLAAGVTSAVKLVQYMARRQADQRRPKR